MNKNKKLLISALVLVVAIATVAVYYFSRPFIIDDMPGRVRGDNIRNIPESKLPYCNFTGAGFVETPCYEAPGTVNL